MRNEHEEDEALRRLKFLLTANPDRVYKAEDLEKPAVLRRALELAYCVEPEAPYDTPTSIHIQVLALQRSRRPIEPC
jgi:hypothetical protein